MDLESWLEERLGQAVVAATPVAGGCIHQAMRVRTADGRLLFVKTNGADALPLLQAEADGLAALSAAAPLELRVPQPLACARVGRQAVLVLSWLDLAGGGAAAVGWSALGRGLARLHRHSLSARCGVGDDPGRFGWARDNAIGSAPQANGWLDDWAQFLVERRLAPQLRQLENQLGPDAFLRGELLLERVPGWLAGHRPEPCLVHGDLWSGNAGVLNDGRGALFDPAVHRADREVDLAMARLFGGFPETFFKAYGDEWPLAKGHGHRLPLYNLYHLMNHASLFGGGYIGQAQRRINDLLESPPGAASPGA